MSDHPEPRHTTHGDEMILHVEEHIKLRNQEQRVVKYQMENYVRKSLVFSPQQGLLQNCWLEVVGSVAWKGDVPQSDLDLMLCTPERNCTSHRAVSLLEELMAAIEKQTNSKDIHLELLSTANVPILRVYDQRNPSCCCHCDISVDQLRSLHHREFLNEKLKSRPSLRSYLQLVKFWLRQRGLALNSEGGLPTLAWVFAALSLAEQQPAGASLQTLLTHFFLQMSSIGRSFLDIRVGAKDANDCPSLMTFWQNEYVTDWSDEWISLFRVEDPFNKDAMCSAYEHLYITPASLPTALSLLYVAELKMAWQAVISGDWHKIWKLPRPVITMQLPSVLQAFEDQHECYHLVHHNGVVYAGCMQEARPCPGLPPAEVLHRRDQSSVLQLQECPLMEMDRGLYGLRHTFQPCNWICTLPLSELTMLEGDSVSRVLQIVQMVGDFRVSQNVMNLAMSAAQAQNANLQQVVAWSSSDLTGFQMEDKADKLGRKSNDLHGCSTANWSAFGKVWQSRGVPEVQRTQCAGDWIWRPANVGGATNNWHSAEKVAVTKNADNGRYLRFLEENKRNDGAKTMPEAKAATGSKARAHEQTSAGKKMEGKQHPKKASRKKPSSTSELGSDESTKASDTEAPSSERNCRTPSGEEPPEKPRASSLGLQVRSLRCQSDSKDRKFRIRNKKLSSASATDDPSFLGIAGLLCLHGSALCPFSKAARPAENPAQQKKAISGRVAGVIHESAVLPVGHEARAPTQTPAREVGLQDMAMGADELRQQLKYLDAKNVTFEFDTAAEAPPRQQREATQPQTKTAAKQRPQTVATQTKAAAKARWSDLDDDEPEVGMRTPPPPATPPIPVDLDDDDIKDGRFGPPPATPPIPVDLDDDDIQDGMRTPPPPATPPSPLMAVPPPPPTAPPSTPGFIHVSLIPPARSHVETEGDWNDWLAEVSEPEPEEEVVQVSQPSKSSADAGEPRIDFYTGRILKGAKNPANADAGRRAKADKKPANADVGMGDKEEKKPTSADVRMDESAHTKCANADVGMGEKADKKGKNKVKKLTNSLQDTAQEITMQLGGSSSSSSSSSPQNMRAEDEVHRDSGTAALRPESVSPEPSNADDSEVIISSSVAPKGSVKRKGKGKVPSTGSYLHGGSTSSAAVPEQPDNWSPLAQRLLSGKASAAGVAPPPQSVPKQRPEKVRKGKKVKPERQDEVNQWRHRLLDRVLIVVVIVLVAIVLWLYVPLVLDALRAGDLDTHHLRFSLLFKGSEEGRDQLAYLDQLRRGYAIRNGRR